MGFYFITHVILGLLAGNSAHLLIKARANPAEYPLWFQSPLAAIGSSVSVWLGLAAIPATFVQYDFIWVLVTISELILGAFFVALLPAGFRFLLMSIGPFISFYIAGALWGFWWI